MDSMQPITTKFILPLTVATLVKFIAKMVDTKKRRFCMECYKDMDRDLTAFIIAFVYLVMYNFDLGKSYRQYVFYAAAMAAIVMFVGIIKFFIDFFNKKNPVSVGAEAAAKAGAEAAGNSESVSEAVVTGAANGAKAAAEAAMDAGMSKEEITEAVVAGQATGATVAEKVKSAQKK